MSSLRATLGILNFCKNVRIHCEDLIELVQRNWDKDCDTRKDYVNSIEIRKVPYPERMRERLENPEGTFVPDYSQTAW